MKTLREYIKNKSLLILFLTPNIIANELPNVYQTDIPKVIKVQGGKEHIADPRILKDSIVILDNKIGNDTSFNFKKTGAFFYMLNSVSWESESRKKVTRDSSYKKIKALKLVEMPGKNYMISDGSFIVKFKDPSNRVQFGIDFSLITKYDFPNRTAYISKGFDGLDKLISDIKSDPRVLSLELDLIDPNIVSQ